jgi:hypothetical protein
VVANDQRNTSILPLAERARAAAAGLIRTEEWFQFYLSPYEALQIEEVPSVEYLDTKVIQRAKKKLLQEIELQGKVSWLDGFALDLSRAHTLDDELLDASKARHHLFVFRDKNLLRFLTRGDIELFIRPDCYSSRATLDLLEDRRFKTFLSRPFARQYDRVLTRAIERQLMPVLEILFNDRRWILKEDEEICFEGTHRRISELVEEMREKLKDSDARKIALSELSTFLQQRSLPELANLLPAALASHQDKFVLTLRGWQSAALRSIPTLRYQKRF